MPRYADMLQKGLQLQGHNVVIWTAQPYFYSLPISGFFKKWLGYLDQFIVFSIQVKRRLKSCSKETLFVFADQALGPWVPLVSKRLHVIHCHDFLALKSALGKIPENPTGFTGKLYQKFIRRGFSKGKNFISISKNTQQDLELLHKGKIETSFVCYNGLNRPFEPLDIDSSREILGSKLNINLQEGYIVHVGGNQYYKNRKGVIEIYNAWRSKSEINLPLLLIGSNPSEELKEVFHNSLFKKDIHFITGLEDEFINVAYSGATCLLFPSLDEGFGWPIAEAMASGCLVITTDRAPMTEVVGKADFFLIPKRPFNPLLVNDWAFDASEQISKIVQLSKEERQVRLKTGFDSIKRFDTKIALDKIEGIYKHILEKK